MKSKYVKKRRPICRIELLGNDTGYNDIEQNQAEPAQKLLKCKIGLKKMKIKVLVKICKTVPRELEKCVKTIKIVKERQKKKVCSYHPKEICHKKKDTRVDKFILTEP